MYIQTSNDDNIEYYGSRVYCIVDIDESITLKTTAYPTLATYSIAFALP